MDHTDQHVAPHFKQDQPDAFDRAYTEASGFPHTNAAAVSGNKRDMGVNGVRRSASIVQTFRIPEVGDAVFIEATGPGGFQRMHLPPEVTRTIAAQRDALTAKSRSRAAKQRAAADKAAGKVPGFLRKVK